MQRKLQGKRGASKGVTLAPRTDSPSKTVEKLPDNPTPDELRDAAVTISLADLEERVADVRDSWETESLFEDTFEVLISDETSASASGRASVCTPEEASRLRRELREYGPAVFCQRTVDSGRYTAKKLLSAFGIKAPAFLEGAPDEDYYSLLSLAITRELSRRAKLSRYNTVDDAVDLIRRSSNIIILTGAGISTSLGIPDFRSKGTGLYSKLEHLGLSDPQEAFDIDVFKQDPTIFYSVAKDIVPAIDRYTPTHKFIAMLHEHGKLLTNYSQNIDNLEVMAGVPKDKLIQCHGSFGTASCIQCGYRIQGEKIFPDIKAGRIPECPRCVQNLRPAGGPPKRKRSAGADGKKRRRWGASAANSSDEDDDSEYDIPTAGIMKPDIIFFGEPLPDEFSKRLTEHDRDKVDLVIVIGTSLKVTPVSEIVSWLPSHIPQIYVSRQAVNHINFDIDLLGDCDVVITELCRRLGWDLNHEMVDPAAGIDVRTEEGYKSRHVFTPEDAKIAAETADVPQ
ncbi:NAD-dependent protein deacetylase-like protein [Hapsidospora chrysogenum ATCC 11550]|uniref:NAD-dependent protein deacetylase-like protein n=1 Tax=Hapsidospora chrysogenum (strain ATCC 11550 / CBS 779.69 / DSM 880 / IAM 14645 / JCM 23072 / IMI 49137) TaxID=857340 RepID=A0A086T965_HAPC1|nr:NAD-dependent protein deacetylase-like protein [Hapsidospora chrysogenum ATCC 11550]